jgi:hypothetical protein
MALLFPVGSVGAVDDPEHGHFEPDPEQGGGFDFPDDLSDRLHRVHYRGKRAWETEIERAERVHETDIARRRDPAMLYDAMERFGAALERLGGGQGDPAQAAEIADLKRQLAELQAAKPAADAATETKSPASRRTSKT